MERDFLGLKWKDASVSDTNDYKQPAIDIDEYSSGGGVKYSTSAREFSLLSHHHQKAHQLQSTSAAQNFHSPYPPTYFPFSNYYSSDSTIKTTPNLAQSNYYNRAWKNSAPDNSTLLSRNKCDLCNPCPTFATTVQDSGSSITSPTYQHFSYQMGHAVVNRTTTGNIAADVRNKAQASEIPAQKLTIFYGNDVHVYEDISPQQAAVVLSMAKFSSMPLAGEMVSGKSHAEAMPLYINSNPAQYSTYYNQQ